MPLWMVALWVLFASTLNCSLQWMQGRYLLAMILGAISGPLCFLAGERLGALQLNDSTWFSVGSIAVSWGLAIPAVFWIAAKMCKTTKG